MLTKLSSKASGQVNLSVYSYILLLFLLFYMSCSVLTDKDLSSLDSAVADAVCLVLIMTSDFEQRDLALVAFFSNSNHT